MILPILGMRRVYWAYPEVKDIVHFFFEEKHGKHCILNSNNERLAIAPNLPIRSIRIACLFKT